MPLATPAVVFWAFWSELVAVSAAPEIAMKTNRMMVSGIPRMRPSTKRAMNRIQNPA